MRASRLRFPHPLILLVGCVMIAAALTWLLPAGQYERREDPAAGREVVVEGTYRAVAPSPVGAFSAMVAIPKGMADAASVIFYVFLVGGAFAVVERTGALAQLVNWLAARLAGRGLWVIPVVGFAFVWGGILIQMQEELIAFVPVLLLLTRRLGLNALTAVAMSLGAAAVGASFSPINPFQVGIAQKVAGLPLLSGWEFRSVFLAVAWVVWIGFTMRFARRARVAPEMDASRHDIGEANAGWRQTAVLGIVLGAFVIFVFGVTKYGWDFEQLSAVFFLMGVAAGLVGRLGVGGVAEGYVEGFRSMAFAALLIGFARAIYVVLDQGHIVDTIVHGLFAPIASLPTTLSALGMMGVQALIHLPVPSTSGQAVLTMPLLVPLSDLIGLSRQVVVLAYQYGAGLCELVTPTNGALMAMLAASGVRYEEWLRFVVPAVAALAALAALAISAAVALGVR
ncbi:MAG TPA: Na+/H+ antiporter NhaC family protein [Gemmatimonadales bacterium]|nr:Na+/H+ antiporter NhaC family protein [Gemmatimonadales bacterium]